MRSYTHSGNIIQVDKEIGFSAESVGKRFAHSERQAQLQFMQ
jgi:hypothetical protein